MLRLTTMVVAVFSAAAAIAKDVPQPVTPGWTVVAPAGATVCADGSPYRFNVRTGSSKKLLIFFNGGGACWSGETCDPRSERPIYVSRASSPANDPAAKGGIFDAARADNPFRDWSMVFVPYCTGDGHIGARRVAYALGEHRFSIEHKGYPNASAALDWAFRHYPAAKNVLVTGSSAGAIAAPFYAGAVARRYPNARVSVLGDGAGAYRAAAIPNIFRDWGVEDIAPGWLRTLGSRPLNIETFFKINATEFPHVRQAQYNAAADAVQGNFLRLLGEEIAVEPALRANLAELRRDISTFRSYTDAGTSHTMLGGPIFFDHAVEGVPLSRWVADFVEGRSVDDIDCADDAKGCTVGP